MQREQPLVQKDFIQLIALPCQRIFILIIRLMCWTLMLVSLRWKWEEKCAEKESDDSLVLICLLVSLKCCPILFFNNCCVLPIQNLSHILHVALQTNIHLRHSPLKAHLPSTRVVALQLQSQSIKSSELIPVISLLFRSPWNFSLKLANL